MLCQNNYQDHKHMNNLTVVFWIFWCWWVFFLFFEGVFGTCFAAKLNVWFQEVYLPSQNNLDGFCVSLFTLLGRSFECDKPPLQHFHFLLITQTTLRVCEQFAGILGQKFTAPKYIYQSLCLTADLCMCVSLPNRMSTVEFL